MNQTENFELEEKLYSKEKWIEDLYPCVTEKYVEHGFTCPKDFMGIRIFDFLNLVGNDRYVAAELLEELSNYLYPDREQEYDTPYSGKTNLEKWMEEHNDLSVLLIGDIMEDQSLSVDEMFEIYDLTVECFYHSKEFNIRKYKYDHISEINYPFPNYE